MPREVDRITGGLEDVPEDHVVDLLRIDLGAIEGRLRRDDAEVGRGRIAERAAVRAERGARAVDADDVFDDSIVPIRVLAFFLRSSTCPPSRWWQGPTVCAGKPPIGAHSRACTGDSSRWERVPKRPRMRYTKLSSRDWSGR